MIAKGMFDVLGVPAGATRMAEIAIEMYDRFGANGDERNSDGVTMRNTLEMLLSHAELSAAVTGSHREFEGYE